MSAAILVILAVVIAGIADAYGFGIAFSLILPIMLLVGIASALGRAMRKRNV